MQEGEPEWRQFELLISRLEKALHDQECKVKSPDKIVDQDTGELREVDASIKFEEDGKEVVVSIECRRRKDKQDVTWIEQLACKKESLGLRGTIAVSSKGFSKSAAVKAAKKGILLRRHEEIVDSAILDDFRATTSVTAIKHSYQPHTLGFITQENISLPESVFDEIKARIKEKEGDAEIFSDVRKGETILFKHLIHLVVRQKQPNEVGIHRYGCRFRFGPNQAAVNCSLGQIFLKALLVGIEWKVEEIRFDNMALSHYVEGDKILMQVAHGSKPDEDNGLLNFEMYFKTE